MKVLPSDFSIGVTWGPLLPVPNLTVGQWSTGLALPLGYCDFESQDNYTSVIWALEGLAPADIGRATKNMAEN